MNYSMKCDEVSLLQSKTRHFSNNKHFYALAELEFVNIKLYGNDKSIVT